MKNFKNEYITVEEAYDISYAYLNQYCDKNPSMQGDIACFLADMSLTADNTSFDSAIQNDWAYSVKKILKINNNLIGYQDLINQKLSILEAYLVLMDFLDGYRDRTKSGETQDLLDKMKLNVDGKSYYSEQWNEWLSSVNVVLNQNPRIRPMLILDNQDKK